MTTPEPIRVAIVDDHFMVRRGLAVALGAEPDIAVVAEAANSDEMLAAYAEHRPDVVLMDWRLPGLNGAEATALLCRTFECARVLMVSALDGDEHVHSAIEAGALGYVLKSSDRAEIVDAVRRVHAGGRYVPEELAAKLRDRLSRMETTSREREVLTGVAAGKSNKEIADALGIAETTVKVFMGRILGKLDARDRAHAAVLAIKRGIIDPP